MRSFLPPLLVLAALLLPSLAHAEDGSIDLGPPLAVSDPA